MSRTIVITGGTSGIGLALKELFEKNGDKVVTIGGIYGTIAEVKDAYVLLEVDKDVKIRVNKQAIQKDYTDPTRQ